MKKFDKDTLLSNLKTNPVPLNIFLGLNALSLLYMIVDAIRTEINGRVVAAILVSGAILWGLVARVNGVRIFTRVSCVLSVVLLPIGFMVWYNNDTGFRPTFGMLMGLLVKFVVAIWAFIYLGKKEVISLYKEEPTAPGRANA